MTAYLQQVKPCVGCVVAQPSHGAQRLPVVGIDAMSNVHAVTQIGQYHIVGYAVRISDSVVYCASTTCGYTDVTCGTTRDQLAAYPLNLSKMQRGAVPVGKPGPKANRCALGQFVVALTVRKRRHRQNHAHCETVSCR